MALFYLSLVFRVLKMVLSGWWRTLAERMKAYKD